MVKPGMFISDRYEIIDKVGTGGMADVYKARCHRLNRFVAIKVLKAEYSDDKNFVEKFRAEAQSAAGLSHTNIVNVYDVGEDNGLYYIVMELVEGITLKTFIERKGKLAVKEALAIAIQIAQGMEAAHENHIIHRDIKPQNMIISKDGKVKVTDFGIAKAASSNTITSNAMGSVHYISPEQARGGYSDERSDIYSLGITMYEMLSGRVPYSGDNTVSVALLHIQGEAEPLQNIEPKIPASVVHIIEKCMQKKPEFRYQSASELIRDLRRAITNPEGDFVKMPQEAIQNSPTIKISDEEVNQIKNNTRMRENSISKEKVPEEETVQEKERLQNITNVSEKRKEQVPVQPENQRKEVMPEKNNHQKKEEEEWEEEDEIEPRLKKVMLLVGIVTAVIFLIVILVMIARFTGIFHKTTGENEKQQENLVDSEQQDNTQGEDDKQKEPNADNKKDEKKVTVPDVMNLDEETATDLLEERGYLVEVEQEYSDVIKKGNVSAQDPEKEEELAKGGTVVITISLGKEESQEEETGFTLQNLSGYSESEATSYLENNGLRKETTSKYSDSIAAGYVIYTSPQSGSTVNSGDTITLVISAGEEVKMVEVPNIREMTESKAKSTLEEKGLDIGEVTYVYSDSYAEGVVMAQDVKEGKEVKEGTSVGFTVSKGKKEEEPPQEDDPIPETKTYYADYYIGVENSPLDDEEEGEVTLTVTQDGYEEQIWQGTITGADFPLSGVVKSTSNSTGKLNMQLDGVDTGFQTTVTFSEEN